MDFTDYIQMTIQSQKSSLQTGLNTFFDTQKDGKIEYSKQAFSKGRQRVKPEAYQELFLSVVDDFYEKLYYPTGKATNCLELMVLD